MVCCPALGPGRRIFDNTSKLTIVIPIMMMIIPQQNQSKLLAINIEKSPNIESAKPCFARLRDCSLMPVEIMIGAGGASFLMSAPNSARS